MSDQHVHIRDLMIVSKEDLKRTGEIPNVTLCGESDLHYDKLTFGDPAFVLGGKFRNACQKCINKWRSESESVSAYKKSYNEFRKILHKMIQGAYRKAR